MSHLASECAQLFSREFPPAAAGLLCEAASAPAISCPDLRKEFFVSFPAYLVRFFFCPKATRASLASPWRSHLMKELGREMSWTSLICVGRRISQDDLT